MLAQRRENTAKLANPRKQGLCSVETPVPWDAERGIYPKCRRRSGHKKRGQKHGVYFKGTFIEWE